MSADTPLDDAEYVALRSYRRDGSAVDTPVWCAGADGAVVAFTLRDSHKVRRIGRNSKVQLARCDIRGTVAGPWHDGTCTLVDVGSEREQRAYAALRRKYGWKMRIGDVFSALSGRKRKRVVLSIVLTGPAAPG